MSDDHADLVAELQALTHAAFDRLEPLLQKASEAAAAAANPEGGEPGPYGCSWCPVCALAALARGEQHDLITLLGSQAAVLLALLRQILDEHGAHPDPDGGPGGAAAAPGAETQGARPKFVPISVQVEHNR
ncbi:hypothetical protein BTZ20_3442 [Rhodococcus sp. MTM3W5.2]|uniref:hypothetical protein n=1 Tax=Rhodococcus sp. MTM3W5.2 TaxID=1805827 RepID=UPI0009791A21|nr:hypothetical protein [Rhodococcus sp. MTM3W5.2]AQA24922.1 hypothetical protein BTZ20_3442 [Rhodococcus sp. MTM3W5.2]